MKRNILILSAITFVILIAIACYALFISQDQKSELTKSGDLKFAGIEMNIPDDWSFLKSDGNTIYVRTDYKPYDVDLVIDYYKNNKAYAKDNSVFNQIEIKDGEIYQNACGGALSCWVAKIGKDQYYFTFNVRSNQEPPENLDGIWTPGHNITGEMIQNIMLSIKSAE